MTVPYYPRGCKVIATMPSGARIEGLVVAFHDDDYDSPVTYFEVALASGNVFAVEGKDLEALPGEKIGSLTLPTE